VRFSLDGKELRGSIQRGDTRGDVVVSALDHQTHQVVAQTHYAGTKESERPAVAGLIETQGLAHQKLSAPAARLRCVASDPFDAGPNSRPNGSVRGRPQAQSAEIVSVMYFDRAV